LVAALLLAACGDSDGGTGEEAATDETAATSAAEGTETSEAAEEPAEGDGAVLVAGIGNEPETLDVGQIRAGTDLYPAVNIFEQLLTRDIEGNLVPGLATEWEVSPDGLEYTFTLREGVTFHNGEPFDADDVAFSFERYIDPELGNVFAYQLANLEGVEVVSPTEVTLRFNEYDGAFLYAGGYAYMVPKDHIESVGDEAFGQDPVGTGPFQFVERRIGEGFTLERFDDYWGDPAGYEQVEVRIIPDDNARVSSLLSGQVDLIAQLPPQNIEQVEAESGYVVKESVTGDNIFMIPNNQIEGAPWTDARVRQAMALAIDQEALREVVLGDLAVPLTGVSALNEGFEDVEITQRPYDPDQARDLLAEAGHPDGFAMELWAPVNGRLPNSEQVTQAVAGYWSEIGIDVDEHIVEYSQWVDSERTGSGANGAIFGLWGDQGSFDPQARMLGSLTCDGPYSHTCDPQLDEMIQTVRTTVDPDARVQAYQDAFEYVHDQAYVIYLYTAEGAFAMSEDVDWQPWHGTPYTRFVNARPA
jgi:peptide/nickel transport system substrate-binding protein